MGPLNDIQHVYFLSEATSQFGHIHFSGGNGFQYSSDNIIGQTIDAEEAWVHWGLSIHYQSPNAEQQDGPRWRQSV